MLGFLNVIIGAGLLVAGRRLFWLLVGGIGFLIGIEVGTRFIRGSEVVTAIAAVVVGIAFAVVAVFLESVAIGLAGFLGGGYALMGLASLFGFQHGSAPIIAFIVGGIVGVGLVVLLFDWALISISSLAGASMIVGGLRLVPQYAAPVYVILLLFGVIFQGLALRSQAPRLGKPAA